MSQGKGKKITIIGAGFSGLSSALYLSRAGFEVEVIEERSTPGGLISTEREAFGLVETAANGLLNSALVESFFSEIGLKVHPTARTARRRFICRDGRPRRWPIGFVSSLRLIMFGIVYSVAKLWLRPRTQETVSAWATRVFGREIKDYLISAVLQGIYAGHVERMSASLIFGRWFTRKAKPDGDRSRRPSVRGTVSGAEGMGQVIRHLEATLIQRGVSIQYDKPARPLVRAPDSPVLIATSSAKAAEILAPLDPERVALLSRVELLPIVTATVCFREPVPVEFSGFGCLMPPIENRRVLGVLMNNYIFSGRTREGYSETWIFGGHREGSLEFQDQPDFEILHLIQEERREIFKVPRSNIIGYRITRWPKAIPHYTVELEQALPSLQNLSHNVGLIGNYLGQIGLAKILERAAKLPQQFEREGQWH